MKYNYLILFLFSFMISSCAGLFQSGKNSSQGSREMSSAKKKSKKNDKIISSFSFPLGGSELAGDKIDRKGGISLLTDLSKNKNDDDSEDTLSDIMIAKALVGEKIDRLLKSVENLAQKGLEENGIDYKIDEKVKLALTISAMKEESWGLFSLWVEELLGSKNEEILSFAFNLKGLAAYKDARIPEAMDYWKKALEKKSSCQSCLLNRGLAAVKYGSFDEAMKNLEKLNGNWIAEFALVSVYRQMGRRADQAQSCHAVMKLKPSHTMALYNCALAEYEAGDQGKARKYLEKALSLSSDKSKTWVQEAERMLEALRAIHKPKPGKV
ncbi:MAG: hypothetical protein KA436_09890 [Oligoflexales bacterium]|nr:hypothetical protein [Oligoflexales bacterium]